MAKSKNLNDELRYEIMTEELERFNKLVKGHKKLLMAVGKL
mgnify:CR=1 FL=1